MIGTIPDRVQHKMPPLTRRSMTVNQLVAPIVPVPGYRSLLHRNNDLLDECNRLWLCACAGIPLGAVIGGLLMLWAIKG